MRNMRLRRTYRMCGSLANWLYIALAVLVSLMVGCGGGGSSNSNPNQPLPSNPQFTTTPSTTAAEGVQYVYAVAATDPAGGTVSLAMTTGPAGAALSGNTLTWTPTSAQSRTSNSFAVTATNTTTGKTATQSWTVTPTGTVRGTRIVTYVTENGDVLQPDDMTQFTIAAHVLNGSGTYTTLPGIGATDGTYSISGVPAGYYWLQQGGNFIWTSGSSVDLGYTKLGRSDLVAPQLSTWIDFNLDQLNPWQSSDALEFFVANTNTEGLYDSPLNTGTTINLVQSWSGPLIDSSKGDRAYVGQLVTNTLSGKTIQVLGKILGPLQVTVTDGSTANVNGSVTDVTLSSLMRGNFRSSAFSQYETSVNPKAVNDGTMVGLGALPGGNTRGLIGYTAYLITYANANGPLVTDVDLGDIAYGNPFPPSWALVLQYLQQFTVQYTAPGASNPITAYPLVYVATTNLPTVTEPLQPLMAPAALPRINGRDLFQNQSAVGQTPTLSWQAPALATPRGYGITVYRLYANGPVSNVDPLAYLWTDSTSVTLPPNLMSPGNAYLFRIRSFYAPGMDLKTAPYRQTFPWAYADAFSAMVNP